MLDVKLIRKDFPMLNNDIKMQNMPLIFLDNASTTFKPQCVIDAVNEYYTTYNANSHRGDYDLCYKVDSKVNEVRNKVAKFINSEVNEVVFTSGTTMSINLIVYGYMMSHLQKGDEVILDVAEHASNLLPWFKLAKSNGVIIKYAPLDENGKVTTENIAKTLTNRTKVISLAAVSNVLGNSVDIKSISKLAHENNILLVIDGAQAVPHMKIDFKDLDIDFLSFSGHKMLGPTGIGCLIAKYPLLLETDSFITGGGMNVDFSLDNEVIDLNPPERFEAGTLNLAGIIGLGAAIDYLNKIGMDEIHAYESYLHQYALNRLKEVEDIIVYNPNSDAGIITFNRKKVFAQDEATLLNYKGIAVRSGQHCAKLLWNYLGCKATVRMSIYLYTSKEDIDRFIDVLKEGGDILDAYFN